MSLQGRSFFYSTDISSILELGSPALVVRDGDLALLSRRLVLSAYVQNPVPAEDGTAFFSSERAT